MNLSIIISVEFVGLARDWSMKVVSVFMKCFTMVSSFPF